MTIPIATSPGRSGFGPQLTLSYDSGSGNGIFGMGWSLTLPSVTRKTDKGLPQYQDETESDVFILSGAEDLVPVLVKDGDNWISYPVSNRNIGENEYKIKRYRPRTEGLFARLERWTNIKDSNDVCWKSISKDNITTWYGKTENSRIQQTSNNTTRIFSWMICESYDDKGNSILYEYENENSENIVTNNINEQNRTNDIRRTNRYLKYIKYGNKTSRLVEPDLSKTDWMFEVVFDYLNENSEYDSAIYGQHFKEEEADENGQIFVDEVNIKSQRDWSSRLDPFSSYRAGFEVRTYRLCHRVLMFHHFPDELGTDDYLVRSTEFSYDESKVVSFITSVVQSGYKLQKNGKYLKKSLPPVEFEYSKATISSEIRTLAKESYDNLPIGVDGRQYQFTDLDGEGLSGILIDQGGGWYYKPNQGGGVFGALKTVSKKPSPGILSGGQQLLDLAGDGQLDLVSFQEPLQGFFERTDNEDWETFKSFKTIPNINWNDPNLKFVDLNGDGHADIFITEDEVFRWYPSLAEDGFSEAKQIRKTFNEEKGPAVIMADGTQSIYLSDISGDGLTDLVRIFNGEVCYWPNLGYGHFGAKVTMDNSPTFDSLDMFDQSRIRLADIDGSGNTDIIYLKNDGVYIYLNESGNSWKEGDKLESFPQVDNLSTVMAADLLGNGTACLVWSSPLPRNSNTPLKYIDLMGGQKPHLLTRTINNLGAENHVHYTASTKFYIKDKLNGNPWITKIPFPVHVVEKVETYDRISKNRFTTQYAYHHGYFDGEDREFRGFGMVEQWDTEEYGNLLNTNLPIGDNINSESHVPPIHTKTWFHTGAYLEGNKISRCFENEYFREPDRTDEEHQRLLLPDTILPVELTVKEEKEACRALKGSILRQEIYADDNSEESFIPYSVSERNYTIKKLQPLNGNKHGVFFVHPNETIDFHYERNSEDPRTSHQLILDVDDYGNVKKLVAISYGRRAKVVESIQQQIVNDESEIKGFNENDLSKQSQILITYTEADYTNAIADENDCWRTPLPSEIRTYELTGFDSRNDSKRFTKDDFIVKAGDDLNLKQDIVEIAYENTRDLNKKQKRLIECVCTLYRSNDLKKLLNKNTLESQALPGESYTLAYTPGLLQDVYRRKTSDDNWENLLPNGDELTVLLSGKSGDQGGYVDLNNNKNWWIPSGRMYYIPDFDFEHLEESYEQELNTANEHFFLPQLFVNPFLHSTEINYDNHDLLMDSTSDNLRNATNALNDYRVLQPEWIRDPNKNCTQVAFDALGMVAGTAIMGKIDEDFTYTNKTLFVSSKGDSLNDFETDLTRKQIEDFMANPREQDINASNLSCASDYARSLLKNATTRIIYDLDRYYFKERSREEDDTSEPVPPFAATIAREKHFRDLADNEIPKLKVSFSYSDGFGREIQKKIQAEAGKVPLRENGKIVLDAHNQPRLSDEDVCPRWVGSGWTIFNNKGKPVRQYEPFFSDTHGFDSDSKIGVSPVLFYDPADRVIATIHPNHTYEKVVFDAWKQLTFDVNDTIQSDPRNDDDILTYVSAYFNANFPNADDWLTWLQQRGVDPENPSQDIPSLKPEKKAAVRSLIHHNTPSIAHLDSLGRTFLTIEHNCYEKATDANIEICDEKYETRVLFDIEGNQREIRDGIKDVYDDLGNKCTNNTDEQGRLVMEYDYSIAGPGDKDEDASNLIHQTSMEAGEKWMLNDVTGKPIRIWKSRNIVQRMVYDNLRRPTHLYVSAKGIERLAEQTVYGENSGSTENHRTRVYQTKDNAGIVTNSRYDFKGNLLESKRVLRAEYKTAVDWQSEPEPNYGNFSSSIAYDALNRPISSITPDKSTYRSTYNEANLLEKVDVNIKEETDDDGLVFKPFVSNINYNAKGQRELISFPNGATTKYSYDALIYRLTNLKTTRPEGKNGISTSIFNEAHVLQNIDYTYDPAGNIIEIRDNALKTIIYNGEEVVPVCDYFYDSAYRLIKAKGREHIGQTGFNFNPSGNNYRDYPFGGIQASVKDIQALRNYTEKYEYDTVGNFVAMRHIANGNQWTRQYSYKEKSLLETNKVSNRLTQTYIGNAINNTETYTYTDDDGNDCNGCMTAINTKQTFWDYEEQLHKVDLGGGGTAYYVYDASGQRVRKVIETQTGTKQKERIYIGGYEVYREYESDGKETKMERESLHIMDDKQRIALVETLIKGSDDITAQLIRYQIGNHLGSASIELDYDANFITYEEYYPYGTSCFQAGRTTAEVKLKRYRYTGKERDNETGLDYYGARYYASWLGRWCSCDPAGFVDGLDLYSYVGNMPCRLVDLNGFQGEQLEFSQAPVYDKRVTATTSGRGITDCHRKENRLIWESWGGDPDAKIDVAHVGRSQGTLGAGETSLTRIDTESHNRSVGAHIERTETEAARARGDFARVGDHDMTQGGQSLKRRKMQPFPNSSVRENAIEIGRQNRILKERAKVKRRELIAKLSSVKNSSAINKQKISDLPIGKQLSLVDDKTAKNKIISTSRFSRTSKHSIKRGFKNSAKVAVRGTAKALPILGDIAQTGMIANSIRRGNYVQAGMDTVGAIPVVGTAWDVGTTIGGVIDANLSEETKDTIGGTINEIVDNGLNNVVNFYGGLLKSIF